MAHHEEQSAISTDDDATRSVIRRLEHAVHGDTIVPEILRPPARTGEHMMVSRTQRPRPGDGDVDGPPTAAVDGPDRLLLLGDAIAGLVRSHAAHLRRPRDRPTVSDRYVTNRDRAEAFLDYRPTAVRGVPGTAATSDVYARRILHVDGSDSRNGGPGGPHARRRSGARFTTTESVIGRDDRVRVYDTDNHPWRMIVNLQISTGRRGEVALGTGFLVARDIVLTAGHCVYDPTTGGWPERISVRPGQDEPSSLTAS